ncbi:MAG: hypothetical protein LAO51_10875 [Acidobacteriia bacterium]|nr:hypothetical protein [Terriglobia bacterium]
MNTQQLIAYLNALTFGDLAALGSKLEEARSACSALGHGEIAEVIEEADVALRGGDLKTYRRKLQTAVARLGHVKNA